MEHLIIFLALVFFVAFIYASVGHGGASGYLALMALFGFAPVVMRPTALMLNLVVSLISFVYFLRGNHFRIRIFLPLALASIPMSFLGGMTHLDDNLYKKILGTLLLIPVARFLFMPDIQVKEDKQPSIRFSLLIGGSIGFLSGVIGIGGGILLSPVILFLRWTDQKQTAAISALFIFVNSIAGLMGQMMSGITLSGEMFGLTAAVLSGALLGAWLGAFKFPQKVMKMILACVLAAASVKLLLI
jgi:uncharacterized membrane protein YfcA